MSRYHRCLSKWILGAALCSICLAQTAPPAPDQPDPEDRNHGVARISLLNGDISVRRGDSGDAVAGAVNAPLLVQDSVQTGAASRAEIQFDYATRLRLGDNADVRIAGLVANQYQVQLAHGTTTLSILREAASQIEVDTPSVAVRPSRFGVYRIAVSDDGTTQITVRAGEVRVDSTHGEERLAAGQTMLARGSADNPEFQIIAAIPRDDWDLFNERRDHELDHAESVKYVSRDIVGAEDLDAYGQWETDPTYGQVWAPRVAAGWAPYRSGRWVWEDYYGWTWVSYDPWGWAPYHYGNWFFGARGWCWYPGAIFAHYWFRPALVGFFGFGGGIGAGFGFGNIGWVALAPFERFHPWYGRGFSGTFGGVGGGIAGEFRNARVANGVTAMNAHDFANGQFGRFSSVGANELRGATAIRGALPVTPEHGSLRFNDRQTGVGARNSFAQTRFASHNQPAQTNRVPFQQQQRQFGPGAGMARAATPAAGNQARVAQTGGWQRFGSPAQNAGGGASSARAFAAPSSQAQAGSSWQRFGSPSSSGAAARSSFAQPSRSYEASPSAAQRSFASAGGSRSVQVAPPMVRERAGASSYQPSYRSTPAPAQRSFTPAGSGSRAQPSYRSAPAESHHSSPAPSHSGGGGGGSHGSRSSGSSHHGR